MKYKSVNEIENFDFKDAVIHELIWKPQDIKDGESSENQKSTLMDGETKGTLSLILEAVIVKPQNSQNSNYTYSYAGDLTMRFTGTRIQKAVKEGYKYYDANDTLLEEYPDVPLSGEALLALLKHLDGAYMWNMTKVEDAQNNTGQFLYLMGIDMGDEEDTTYWLQLTFSEVVMEWEKYMNRVEMN